MDPTALVKLFKKNERELDRFDRVKKPPHKRQDLAGLLYLAKLCPGEAGFIYDHVEGDTIVLGVTPEELAAIAKEEDVVTLLRCGIQCGKENLFVTR